MGKKNYWQRFYPCSALASAGNHAPEGQVHAVKKLLTDKLSLKQYHIAHPAPPALDEAPAFQPVERSADVGFRKAGLFDQFALVNDSLVDNRFEERLLIVFKRFGNPFPPLPPFFEDNIPGGRRREAQQPQAWLSLATRCTCRLRS